MRNDDCVCGQDESWFAELGIVNLRGVDVRCFLRCGLENIFEGRE